MPLPRNVILTGFMGSGKTSVGRRLAARMRWRFVDLDGMVARRARMSVQEIFQRKGEAAFRRMEHRALRSLVQRRRWVIAAGGGVPIYRPNRSLLRKAGLTVWLRVPVLELARRLRGGAGRPLLAPAAGRARAVRALITKLLLRRTPFLRAVADISVSAGRGRAGEVAARVARAVAAAHGPRR